MKQRPAVQAVLAVDGGNSKTDLVLARRDGSIAAIVRGPTVSHEALGMEAATSVLTELVGDVANEAGIPRAAPLAEVGVYCLAGADFPADIRRLGRAVRPRGWTDETVILNDTLAALRAGTEKPWGVVLVCGQGVNAAGLAPGGKVVRLAGVGAISGDWGGGFGLGLAALGAAVRARDGRGPRTILERSVPRHFGFARPIALTEAVRSGRVPAGRLGELAPLVFSAAQDGDAVARSLVDRLADELVTMAAAVIRRLHLTQRETDVVLAGGVFRTDDRQCHERVAAGIRAVAPKARLIRLDAPPVLGAALLGFDRLALEPREAIEVRDRLREEIRSRFP